MARGFQSHPICTSTTKRFFLRGPAPVFSGLGCGCDGHIHALRKGVKGVGTRTEEGEVLAAGVGKGAVAGEGDASHLVCVCCWSGRGRV